ncbi:hypothetical protein B0I32_116107 [Nonomuraea fuscirosea]|uniref:Uncharacterized protein n=1 Tax=Nonomuraea fuscirosea TaxID=1291556 RepID=A0A2T0MR71_9ACTN|nr:hypothetical protein [Nonomuraea fuscirosea]PRX60716.1 hypothetical protein B0I32_116107 [Nonomuraea fuscirosea]
MDPDAIARRARRHGWTVQFSADPGVVLLRRAWRLEITFVGNVPSVARIMGSERDAGRPVNLRSINTLIRARPDEIAQRAAEATLGEPAARTEDAGP